MNINELDIRKTGLLFFDLLNVYYRGAPEETQKRMRPVVDNAVRLLEAARHRSIPVFYAMANHRADGQIRSMIVTDTDMRLRPWPNGESNPSVHGATEGSWEQKVIDELKPAPHDYVIAKYRWSTFHQTYFDLPCARVASTRSLSRAAPSMSELPRLCIRREIMITTSLLSETPVAILTKTRWQH
jgi:isochorismate hydrolase